MSLFAVSLPEKVVLQEVYREITKGLTTAYMSPEVKEFLNSQSVESLLSKTIEYYVGSKSN